MSECVQREAKETINQTRWSENLISPSSRTGNVSSLVNTNSFVSAVFEPQKEYKDSGI